MPHSIERLWRGELRRSARHFNIIPMGIYETHQPENMEYTPDF
jgi:hypothetical protein